MCNFGAINMSGGQLDFQYYIPRFIERQFEGQIFGSANNAASSAVSNGRTSRAFLYDGEYGAGRCVGFSPNGGRIADFRTIDFNDKASSGYFASYAPANNRC